MQIGPRELAGTRDRWQVSEWRAPGFQQVETFIVTPPSAQCGQSGPLELPRGGKWVGVMNTHLSTSVPVPCVSAPGSASAVPPAAGNPLLAGVLSTERGVGVTTLCRSNSRLAHLVKVPGRFHLQARAQQPVGGTDYPDPTEEGGMGMPSPATTLQPPPPPADGLRPGCSPPAQVSWYSGSLPPPHCPGPEPAAPGPPGLGTRVK